MGVQRVVLEHHGDVAVLGRGRRDVAVAKVDRPGGEFLEAGQHPQRRRLAAAGRADQHHELAVGDVQVHLATAADGAFGYQCWAFSNRMVAMGFAPVTWWWKACQRDEMPPTMPLMKRFCSAKNSTAMGRATITPAAASSE